MDQSNGQQVPVDPAEDIDLDPLFEGPLPGDPPEPAAPENTQIFKRAKKAEGALKVLREAAGVESTKELFGVIAGLKKPDAQAPQPQPVAQLSAADDKEKKIAVLQLNVKGYNDAEAEFILRNGGNPADPYVAAAIQAMRDKAAVEQATPSPSARGVPVNTAPFSQLPKKEKEAGYAGTISKLIDKARSK